MRYCLIIFQINAEMKIELKRYALFHSIKFTFYSALI